MKDSKYTDARVKSYFLRRKARVAEALEEDGYVSTLRYVPYKPTASEIFDIITLPFIATSLVCQILSVSGGLTLASCIASSIAGYVFVTRSRRKEKLKNLSFRRDILHSSSNYETLPIKKSIKQRMANV